MPIVNLPNGSRINFPDGTPEEEINSAIQQVMGGQPSPAGQLQAGNIDLQARPVVRNPDGSISTVRSMSVNIDGRETLLPTVSDDGRILSEQEAIDNFLKTGRHLGQFDTPEAATAYAQQLHTDQQRLYRPSPRQAEDESMAAYNAMPKRPDNLPSVGLQELIMHGMSAGLMDEIGATGAATGAGIREMTRDPSIADLVTGNTGSRLDRASKAAEEAYDTRLAEIRRGIKRYREEHPILATAGEIVGAVPTAITPVFAGRSLLGKLIGSGVTGAAQGGLYGFNTGEGGFEERAANAVAPAVIGGGIGVGAPIVARGAAELVDQYLTGRLARQLGMDKPTFDILNRAMQADDSLTGAGAARLQQAGADAMLADSGPNARTILDTAIQRSGPAGSTARQAIEQRAATAGQQINDAMDTALGLPGGVKTVETALRKGTAGARDAAYTTAYAQPIDYASDIGQRIENIVTSRVPHSAIRAANNLIRTEGGHTPQILVKVADDGSVTFGQMPTVAQIDYITRGLNEVADKANGQGALGGTTQTGRAYANLSRDLRGLLRQAVPEYGVALDTAAEPIAARKALQFGRDMLSTRLARDEVAETVGGMSQVERLYAAQGLRSTVDEALANVRRAMTDTNVDAREAVKAIKDLSSRASREKVSALIGDSEATRLFDELDKAAMALDLRAGVATNSRTFARLSMDDIINGQVEDGAINALREGKPVNAGKRLVQNLLGRTAEDKARIADQTYGDLVQMLTGPRGQDAVRLLQQMQAVPTQVQPMTDQTRNLVEMLLRRNAPAVGPLYQNTRAQR